jgi:site-specific recombinase XerD
MMPDKPEPFDEETELKALVSQLDEEALASILAMEFEDYLAELVEDGLDEDTVKSLRSAFEYTYLFAIGRVASLVDRAGHVKWLEVTRRLRRMLWEERPN